MKKSHFSEEQIIGVLKEHAAGIGVAELCRKHGISDATLYTWRKRYGGMEVSDAKRLKALEDETPASRSSLLNRCSTWRRCARHSELLTPGARRSFLSWAIEKEGYSQRRACP